MDWTLENKPLVIIEPEVSREYFTPPHMVGDMCDTLEPAISDIEKKIFEPSCGEGIFLLEVIERRMKKNSQNLRSNNKIILTIAIIDLVKNIYGADIVPEFVDVTRSQVLKKVSVKLTEKKFTSDEIKKIKNFLKYIVSWNVVCFDTLNSENNDRILLNDWSWKSQTKLNFVSYAFSDVFNSSNIHHIAERKQVGHFDIQKVIYE